MRWRIEPKLTLAGQIDALLDGRSIALEFSRTTVTFRFHRWADVFYARRASRTAARLIEWGEQLGVSSRLIVAGWSIRLNTLRKWGLV